ncbi:MAG: hypothetical protein ACREAB_20960 [Blastocatellia bacterium]
MADFDFGINSLTVFLGAATIGFAFLLVSFFLGDLFERIGLDIDLGGGGAEHDLGWFDSRVLSMFVTAFGGFGAIATLLGLGVVVSSALGLVGGMALGGTVLFFGRLLYKQQASSSVGAQHLIGRIAKVTVTIQPGGVGQISCLIGEERVEKLARSRNDIEIKVGVMVIIEEVRDDGVIVSADEEITKLFIPASL